MTKTDLLSQINKSFFSDKSFDFEDVAYVRPEYTTDAYEGNAVADFFKNKRNHEIKLSDLLDKYPCDHTACFSFMKPEAAAYFIGTYLHIGVEEDLYGQDIRVALAEIFSGVLYETEREMKWFECFISFFNSAQKETIRCFLDYLDHNHRGHVFMVDFNKAKRNFS